MNTKTLLNLTICGALSLGLCGCGGEDIAQSYASQLASVLKSYQDNIDKHLKAQVATYRNLAKDLDKYAEKDANGSLDSERAESEMKLRDQLLDTDAKTKLRINSTSLRAALSTYADHEFAANKQTVTAELDAYKRFLIGIQGLEQETANIAQLRKLLQDLSQKKSAWGSMKDAVAFGQSVKTNYDKLKCDGVKAEVTELTKEIADLDTQSGPIEKAIADLKVKLKAAKSKAEGEVIQKDIDVLKAKSAALAVAKTSSQSDLKAAVTRHTGCK